MTKEIAVARTSRHQRILTKRQKYHLTKLHQRRREASLLKCVKEAETIVKYFPYILRYVRALLKMNQKELADYLDYAPSLICKWGKREKLPRPAIFIGLLLYSKILRKTKKYGLPKPLPQKRGPATNKNARIRGLQKRNGFGDFM